MNKKHLISIISFITALKVTYFVLSYLFDKGFGGNSFIELYSSFAEKFDANWYKSISEEGYPIIKEKIDLGYSNGPDYKQSAWAFFPFYPLLLAGISQFLSISLSASAFFINLFFSYGSFILIYLFAKEHLNDEHKAFIATLMIAVFPYSYYFSMYYTESQFFFFLILCFISIQQKNYWLLFFSLIPLSLLRPNGLILLLPLYLYHLEQKDLIKKFNFKWETIFEKKNIIKSLAFLSSPITFLSYCIYQKIETGYFFAFSIAQAGWYRKLSFPLASFFNSGQIEVQFNSAYTILIILFIILTYKRNRFSLNVFLIISLLLPLSSGSTISMTRFISLLFPIMFTLSMITTKKQSYLTIGLLLVLHFLSFWTWAIGHPICY